MKSFLSCCCMSLIFGTVGPVHARGISEASEVSVLVTGSVVVMASALPLMAMQSLMDAAVASVKPAGNGMTDVEVRQRSTQKACTVRVPDQAIEGKGIKPGQKAALVADPNGHILQIEGQQIAYIPARGSDALLHSKALK